MSSEKERKKKNFFQRILTVVFLGTFFYSVYELGDIFMDYYENRKVMAEAQNIYEKSPMEEQSQDGEVRKQFKALQQINQEIVGWITMDDTQINYPIVQAKDNDYYLFRNYKGEDMRAGSIFMDYRNDVKSQNRNTILYGHRMKDGSMFGSLKKMLDEESSCRIVNYITIHYLKDMILKCSRCIQQQLIFITLKRILAVIRNTHHFWRKFKKNRCIKRIQQ